MTTPKQLLTWSVGWPSQVYQGAMLGYINDGVMFTLSHHPTCNRRGPYRLLIEILNGEHYHKWGCFDDQDQPMRYFHSETNAKSEAELIAQVLYADRHAITKMPGGM